MNFKRILTCCLILFFVLSFNTQGADKQWSYTVLEGESLWSISQKYLNETLYYEKLRKHNKIKHPKNLQPNTLIKIPMSWIKANPASATVSAISGNSTYLNKGKIQTTKLGSILNLGDTLTVDDNSSVTIRFVDGSILTLLEKSQLVFEHLISYSKTGMTDTQLKLHYGKVETQAKKSTGPGSRLDISTGSALSSVRGTVYRVAHSKENSHSLIEVIEGEVEVEAQKHSESIAAGFASKVVQGQVPSKPIVLLKAPHWQSKKTHFEGEVVNFSWQENIHAKAYKVQLSTSSTFTNIIWQQQQTKKAITLPEIEDGHYFIRVSAIDFSNIEGFTRSSSFSINNIPLAPSINKVEALDDTDKSHLTWTPVDKGIGSFLQIASDSDFTDIVLSKSLYKSSFALSKTLPFGKYYWRVAATDIKGRGPFSRYDDFIWQPLLSSVEWSYQNKDDDVLVYWSTLKFDESVQIQTTDSPDFTSNVTTYESLVKKQLISLPDNGNVYIRSRVVNKKNNIHGDWSTVKNISNSDDEALLSFAFLALFILL